MAAKSFKDKWLTEWRRLNPRYVLPGDDLWQTFKHGFQEGLPGFFAPLRMLWWLCRGRWRG